MVLFSAAVLSGILYGLPEVPIVWKIAAGVLLVFAICFAGVRNRGKQSPLFFLLCSGVLLLFACGFLRSSVLARRYSSEEAAAFFKEYQATNPGQFDYSLYLKSKDITSEEERERSLNQLSPVQEFAASVLESHLNTEDSGVFRAMLIGDKTALDDTTKSLYQSSGISHLLAVSGLHVGMAGAFVSVIAGNVFHCDRNITLVLSGCFGFAYAVLTGAGASSLRAALMFFLGRIAVLSGRKYDPLTALSLAAAMLTLLHPYLILQSGFQLSFTAMLGIIASNALDSGKKKNSGMPRKNSMQGKLQNSLRMSLCVSLATLPPLAAAYYQTAFWSFLLNLAVIPLMTVIMVSAFLVLGFGSIEALFESIRLPSSLFRFLSVACAAPGHYVLKFYELLCSQMQKLPLTTVTIGKPSAYAVILYYLFFFALIFLLTHKPGLKVICPVLFVFYGLSHFLLRPLERTPVYVTVLDVGQGDCFHIHAGDRDIVIDCGSSGYERAGSRILEPYLLSKAITELDAVIVSHADSDHINGLVYLLEESDSIEIGQLLLPPLADQDDKYQAITEAAQEKGTEVKQIRAGSILGSDQLQLQCVYAEEDPAVISDTNRESAVFLLKCEGLKMLFTGDITEAEEEKIAEKYEGSELFRDMDVLKCSHHGSDTANSEAFLRMVHPRIAVLSYGAGNRYGHPAEEVLERLEEQGVFVWSTAISGAGRIEPGEKEAFITAP